ncbi:hypothetical protein AB0L82_35935 [Nocardia sp. NPDC052001]|uniref:hypothetical protein n=1 Tax=Nocardia sp. NPDC052001 TaxID=3154853 RepID=UPI00343206A5
MPETRSCWLILGPWHTRYDHTTDNPRRGLHRLAAVPAPGGRTTRVVTWNHLRYSRSVLHTDPHHRALTATAEPLAYRQLTLTADGHTAPEDMPLVLLAPESAGWAVYLPVRLGDIDALFHRVDIVPEPTSHITHPSLDTVHRTLQALPGYSKTVGSHECWYFKHDPDTEYEHKFTLDPGTDIYRLARDVKAHIGHGDLARYRAEYRNDFELWSFANHMFEVTGPTTADRGYASFIPRAAGGYTIKRKHFTHDQFRRTEHKTYWPAPHATLAHMHTHLNDTLAIHAHYLGSFDRIRFDDMLESSDTGHIYSLMTDRCNFHGYPAPLQQLEIEYIRSRGDARDCEHEIIAELDHLRDWTQHFLIAHDVTATADYTSKYTHLRQLAAPADPYPPRP